MQILTSQHPKANTEVFVDDASFFATGRTCAEVWCAKKAGVLVIRSIEQGDSIIPVSKSFADKLLKEQDTKVKYDTKYWDNRRKRTLNKIARKNIVFGNKEIKHSEDYKQSSVKIYFIH